MATLPCFVGDADPLLSRAPGAALHMHGTLWLLAQGESRGTKRVRLFTEFILETADESEPIDIADIFSIAPQLKETPDFIIISIR
jgi:hypothetical protein